MRSSQPPPPHGGPRANRPPSSIRPYAYSAETSAEPIAEQDKGRFRAQGYLLNDPVAPVEHPGKQTRVGDQGLSPARIRRALRDRTGNGKQGVGMSGTDVSTTVPPIPTNFSPLGH